MFSNAQLLLSYHIYHLVFVRYFNTIQALAHDPLVFLSLAQLNGPEMHSRACFADDEVTQLFVKEHPKIWSDNFIGVSMTKGDPEDVSNWIRDIIVIEAPRD